MEGFELMRVIAKYLACPFPPPLEGHMSTRFLDRRSLAESLNISLSTVDRGIKANIYPFNNIIRIGRKVLFPADILDELALSAKQGAEPAGKDNLQEGSPK
jgi:hypothetical protein